MRPFGGKILREEVLKTFFGRCAIFRFYYREGSGQNNVPIVFLHGWGGDGHSFDAVSGRLSEFDRYSPDLYGFGRSPLERVMTVDEYADSVAEFLRTTVKRRALVVAHSFGGRVAVSLAARYPSLIAGTVLVSSAGMKPRRRASYYFKVARYKILKAFGRAPANAGSADYRGSSGYLRGVMSLAVRFYQEGQCKKISVPVLVIYGKQDRETPPYTAKRLHRLIKGSGLIALDGDHFCYLRNAALFAEITRAFARGIT